MSKRLKQHISKSILAGVVFFVIGVVVINLKLDYIDDEGKIRLFGYCILASGSFVILLAIGLLISFCIKLFNRHNLVKNGIPILTEFSHIDAHWEKREELYQIISEYRDPIMKSKVHTFKSDFLCFNPTSYIDPEKPILVYVAHRNYKEYVMVLSDIPNKRKEPSYFT